MFCKHITKVCVERVLWLHMYDKANHIANGCAYRPRLVAQLIEWNAVAVRCRCWPASFVHVSPTKRSVKKTEECGSVAVFAGSLYVKVYVVFHCMYIIVLYVWIEELCSRYNKQLSIQSLKPAVFPLSATRTLQYSSPNCSVVNVCAVDGGTLSTRCAMLSLTWHTMNGKKICAQNFSFFGCLKRR